MCSLGNCWGALADDGVLGLIFDCLNVMRVGGGGIPGSSRLRFPAVESLDGVRVVRTLLDRVKCRRP